MQIVADLHLHSKYSRAVSPNMIFPVMSSVSKQKGIDILGTGDFTHPLWFKEIKSFLTEAEEGLLQIKNPKKGEEKTRFLLSVEISNIYSDKGKGRRIHNLVLSPSMKTSEKINKELPKRGYNIISDGRPIIGLSSKNLLELILTIDSRCMLIPCHIWTPWFGIYGKSSGYNSLSGCFEELAPFVYGIETGLSSDPQMNWEVSELNTRSILSFSDAHSPAKMGREATVFEVKDLSYEAIRQAIMQPSQKEKTGNKVAYTIEFYPEEGKYHYSGHRKCHVSLTPQEQIHAKNICPVCGKKVTDGVMRRVEELANQHIGIQTKQNEKKVTWIMDPKKNHPPFVKIVPLNEIIAQALKKPVTSPRVKELFDVLCEKLESEFYVLLHAEMKDIARIAGKKVADGIEKVREMQIQIIPGYDGIYGVVNIWDSKKTVANKDQLSLKM